MIGASCDGPKPEKQKTPISSVRKASINCSGWPGRATGSWAGTAGVGAQFRENLYHVRCSNPGQQAWMMPSLQHALDWRQWEWHWSQKASRVFPTYGPIQKENYSSLPQVPNIGRLWAQEATVRDFNKSIRKGSPGTDTTLDLCWKLLFGHLNIPIQFSYTLDLG